MPKFTNVCFSHALRAADRGGGVWGEHSFKGVFTGIRNKYELDTARKSSDRDDKDDHDDHDDNDDDDDKDFVINKKTVQ